MAFLNYENKGGSGKKLKVHFDLPEDDDYPNQKHSRSSSGSSLDSDSTDKDDNSIDNNESKYGVYGSPVWSFQGGSVTQSPPVQFMSPPGYDPNRIPSSVFGNRSTSPMEWSVASNESLFSIHLGNNSFSRDHVFPHNKSGELLRTNDGFNMPTTLPPVQELNASGKNMDMERHSVSSDSSSESADSVGGHDHAKASHEAPGSVVEVVDLKKTETSSQVGTNEIVLDKTPEDHHKEEKAPNTISYRSVGSDLSTRSFQFPILTPVGGRTSSSTEESEKPEKIENQEQQPENAVEPPSAKAEKEPKQSGRSWCFCFSCSPCF